MRGDWPEVADRITAEDLVAVQTLSVTVPAPVALDILEGCIGVQLSGLLHAIPRDIDMVDAEADVLALIDAMLRSEILIKGVVVHERLVAEYGFTGTYQRIKLYMQEARPGIAEELGISPGELAGLHRRFEVVPGAQAQVDWGDEGQILAHVGT